MRVFHQLKEVPSDSRKASVAIGNFDGVHRGHRQLIQTMLAYAAQHGSLPTVLTFFPHPVEVLRPGTKRERLTTTSEKLLLLEDMGVKLVLVEKFDRELAALDPEAFFSRYLRNGLRAASIHVGADFRFGKNRLGDTEVLKALAQRDGISVQVEPPFLVGSERISSSVLRHYLSEGDTLKAAEGLGRPFFLQGQVVSGDGRGAPLGFATANVRVPEEKELPRNGVYVTRVRWQRQTFRSVTNVGLRPTFAGVPLRPRVETHLLDFSARLYDEILFVEFFERIRDEKKFESVDALKAQIALDVEVARRSNSFTF